MDVMYAKYIHYDYYSNLDIIATAPIWLLVGEWKTILKALTYEVIMDFFCFIYENYKIRF